MISQEGAALIATLYPVGLLILGIEIRSTPQFVATATFGRVILIYHFVLFFGGLVGGLYSVWACVSAIASGRHLEYWESLLVGISGWFLFISVAILFLENLLDHVGFLDWLAESRSPEEKARAKAYIESHSSKGDGL